MRKLNNIYHPFSFITLFSLILLGVIIAGYVFGFTPPSQPPPDGDVESSGAIWGSITGTLSNQTDLQGVLDGKLSSETDPVVKALTGIITSNGSTISAITNSSSNWNSAYDHSTNTTTAHNLTIANVSQLGSTISESELSISDNTTGNVSITKHGFVPKAPDLTTQFLRGDGTWAAPAGGGDVVGDDTSTITQNIVAYSGTGGKNITELTGDQGDVLYHNGANWVKLTAGTSGNFLKTNGAGANPAWAAAGGTTYTLVARLASDQATGANTTPVSLTGLVFTYEANSTYRIWFMGRVAPTAATTGCGFQFDLSSAVTSVDVIFYHQLANAGTTSGGHSIADDASVGVSSGMPGTSTYTVSGEGILITTSNTGTAQMRFRSETTAVTTAKAGMTLVVEKIL